MPEVPRRRPGLFVVDLDGAMIGFVTFDRRAAERPGHVRPEAGEAELGYLFLPRGVGTRVRRRGVRSGTRLVRRRASRRAGGARAPRPPTTRSMRLAAKLGFTEVERFEEFGAEQWFGMQAAGAGELARAQRGLTRPSSRVPSAAKPKQARVSPSVGSVLSVTPATSSRSSLTAASARPSSASRQIRRAPPVGRPRPAAHRGRRAPAPRRRAGPRSPRGSGRPARAAGPRGTARRRRSRRGRGRRRWPGRRGGVRRPPRRRPRRPGPPRPPSGRLAARAQDPSLEVSFDPSAFAITHDQLVAGGR